MASNILRVATRSVLRNLRPAYLSPVSHSTTVSTILPLGFTAGQNVPDGIYDPEENPRFFESLYTPIPPLPRVVIFNEELQNLKDLEKGDWSKMTTEQHVDLYNAYFGMTMTDMMQGSDLWKSVLGTVMLLMSFAMFIHWVIHEFVNPPYHHSVLDEEWVAKMIKKQLQNHSGPITGYASKWDYEKNCWK